MAKAAFWTKAQSLVLLFLEWDIDKDEIFEIFWKFDYLNKTKDWALVQNAALAINIRVIKLG